MIKLLQSKLHWLHVTSTNANYIGSIAIDSFLLNKVGILPLQEVEVVNLNNGKRWSTYALPAKANSGVVSPNGGGALLCDPGDKLIVFSYKYCNFDKCIKHNSKVAVIDEGNKCRDFFTQELEVSENGEIKFDSPDIYYPDLHTIEDFTKTHK